MKTSKKENKTNDKKPSFKDIEKMRTQIIDFYVDLGFLKRLEDGTTIVSPKYFDIGGQNEK